MADETIRIVVDDESSKKDEEAIGQEIVSQADTGPQLEAGGVGGQEPPEPPDTTDFEADVSSLDAVLEAFRAQQEQAFQELAGTTENIAAAGADVEGFSEQVNEAGVALETLVDGEGELSAKLDALSAALTEVTDDAQHLANEWDALSAQINQSQDEWENVAEELTGSVEEISKSGLQMARQTANLARAAGVIGSNANQIVAAGTALAKSLGPIGVALVIFTVAVAATILAIKALDKAAESLSKEIGGFSGEAAVATAEKRILVLEDRIRLADERGSQAAEFIEVTSDLNSEVREFKRDMMAVLLPLATFLGKVLASILDAINSIFGPILHIAGWSIELIIEGIINLIPGVKGALDALQAKKERENEQLNQGLNQDLIDLFDPGNVGFSKSDRGQAQEEAAQDRFDEILKPPPAPSPPAPP